MLDVPLATGFPGLPLNILLCSIYILCPWNSSLRCFPTFHQLSIILHKQPPEVFCEKSCSGKFCNIHRKAPVLESLFHKVVGLQVCNFIKQKLQHRCFLCNLAKFVRTSILKNICERLLLIAAIPGRDVARTWQRWRALKQQLTAKGR